MARFSTAAANAAMDALGDYDRADFYTGAMPDGNAAPTGTKLGTVNIEAFGAAAGRQRVLDVDPLPESDPLVEGDIGYCVLRESATDDGTGVAGAGKFRTLGKCGLPGDITADVHLAALHVIPPDVGTGSPGTPIRITGMVLAAPPSNA